VLETNFAKNQFFSNYYLERADFVRLDNMSVSRSILNRSNFRLNASAIIQNAFVFTRYSGIDPEHANGIDNNIYPRPRTYSLALNFQF
jgi:iron complex outermembrane receptor protein